MEAYGRCRGTPNHPCGLRIALMKTHCEDCASEIRLTENISARAFHDGDTWTIEIYTVRGRRLTDDNCRNEDHADWLADWYNSNSARALLAWCRGVSV